MQFKIPNVADLELAKIKVALYAVLSTAIIVSAIWLYYHVTGIIESKDKTIVELNTKVSDLTADVAVKTADVSKLRNEINVSNFKLKSLNADLLNTKVAFENWKKQPPIIKYKNKIIHDIINVPAGTYDTYDCELSKQLDKNISEIKYEEI